MPVKAFRSAILDFVADPFFVSESESVRYIRDGLLVVENGAVKELGAYEQLREKYAGVAIESYPDQIILPGFIDLHIHFPQTEMIAAYSGQLLEWLEKFTFPVERKFRDKAYCEQIAPIFIDQLLRNGTTTALVLAAVFPESVEALFEESDRRKMRLIAGKVMMDRNAPDFLKDTAQSSYHESKALIEKWHKKGRSLYAVTPRFAPTSTPEQLAYAAKLLEEFPDTYLHTHLSENVNEVAWVKELFLDSKGYVDVYDQFGLVGERSIFAHCVQLTEAEFDRLAEAKSAIAFCPTSNTFLGSGLFNLERATSAQIKVGLATDVGGGTSFSMLQTANEAYKIAQLRRQKLSPFQAIFLATLGGARALYLDDEIGNFEVGKEADFIVIDPRSTPILALRNQAETPTTLEALSDRLFSLIIMGDDRAIRATYILGELAYENASNA
ncbi:MAG: guanine deaminase [Leptolyngbya sp. ERB_1_1]